MSRLKNKVYKNDQSNKDGNAEQKSSGGKEQVIYNIKQRKQKDPAIEKIKECLGGSVN